MKRIIPFVALAAMLAVSSVSSAQVTKTLDRSGAIHDAAGAGNVAAGAGNVADSTDYYGSGNDDDFSEFGVATFTYSAADFGVESISDITQFDYTLTHNDRGFSDGTEFELFLTTDDFDTTYTGLSYDVALINGLDISQFTNISSLGTFPYSPADGGTLEPLTIGLTGTQEADLVNEINTGSEFSILIVATATDADITFTAFDDTFEPGGQPFLTINSSTAVPEPTSLAVLTLAGLAGFTRRRR